MILPPFAKPEVVARLPMSPAGVAVAGRRVFLTFPRYGGEAVPFTLGELRNGKAVPYPDLATNDARGEAESHLLSTQNAVVARDGTLWALDSGFRSQPEGVVPGGPKIVVFDLDTNRVVRRIPLGEACTPKSFPNDLRVDLAAGAAYLTDAPGEGPNAIIVVDLATGRARRRLENDPSVRATPGFVHVVEGRPLYQDGKAYRGGANSIALGAGGTRLYYAPLSSRRMFSVPTAALRDPAVSDEALGRMVEDGGDKGQSGGMTSDEQGHVYTTAQEYGAVLRWSPTGVESVYAGPEIVWPDTLDLTDDGWLYLTCAQYNRRPTLNGGEDRRKPPYLVLRFHVGGTPVRR